MKRGIMRIRGHIMDDHKQTIVNKQVIKKKDTTLPMQDTKHNKSGTIRMK